MCEDRDSKGRYANARRRNIKELPGIDDPYKMPDHPEITINSVTHTFKNTARFVLAYFAGHGFVQAERVQAMPLSAGSSEQH